MRFFSALLSLSLTALLAFGQTAGLTVRAVEQNAAPDGISVEVTDASGHPVTGATVVFRLPDSSVFSDGKADAVAETDNAGRAEVLGIRWGTAAGTVPIRITATKDTAHAGLLYEKAIRETTSTVAPAVMQPQNIASQPERPAPVTEERAQPIQRQAERPAVPGVIVANDDSPNANVPIRPLVAEAAGGMLSPKLSIVSNGQGSSDHHLRNRILIGLAVAAGAGAAVALTHGMGHSSGSSGSGVTIGPPNVSVGH